MECFGPMHIDCMSILLVVVQYLNVLKVTSMLIFSGIMYTIILKANTTCAHGLTKKVGKSCKLPPPGAKQVKKLPTTTVFKIFTYVQNERNQTDKSFDCTPR